MGDVLAVLGVLVGPARMLAGFLAVVAMIVIGLAEADAADGRLLVRRSSADRRP